MTASGMGCKKSHLHSAGRCMATSVLVVLAEDAFEGVVCGMCRGHGVVVTWAHTSRLYGAGQVRSVE